MKRGGPLKRTTPLSNGDKPLARGDGLRRATPLARGDKPMARTGLIARTGPIVRTGNPPRSTGPSKPRKPGVTSETRLAVLARCGGLCEACGGDLERGGGVHMHHRQRRRTGDHSLANLVALHPDCHVVAPQAVHQRPEWATERGLIVRSTDDPAATP